MLKGSEHTDVSINGSKKWHPLIPACDCHQKEKCEKATMETTSMHNETGSSLYAAFIGSTVNGACVFGGDYPGLLANP